MWLENEKTRNWLCRQVGGSAPFRGGVVKWNCLAASLSRSRHQSLYKWARCAVCDYHDNQVFSGRSQRFQRLRLIGRSLVVKCGPPDVKLPGPVDGPGSVDVIILLFRFQSCTEKKGKSFRHLVMGELQEPPLPSCKESTRRRSPHTCF